MGWGESSNTNMVHHKVIISTAAVSLLPLLACSTVEDGEQQDPSTKAPDVEELLVSALAERAAPVPEPLRLAAARDELGDDAEISGVVLLDSGHSVYLVGSPEDAEAYLSGVVGPTRLGGVVVGNELGSPACVGIIDRLPEDPSRLAAATLRECVNGSNDWVDIIATNLEQQDEGHPDSLTDGPSPVQACAVACGVDDGYTYAGEQAYSNGADTGTGSSCNGSDTYGYRYQCVQYTERVHKRSDWSGNAYTGYWSSTTAGPWQKGLLPLVSGNTITPPRSGDILVWSTSATLDYGHVGIVASVGASTLTMYDQNRSCGSQSCSVGYSSASGYSVTGGTCLGQAPIGYARRGWDFSGAFGISGWSVNDMPYVSGTTSGSNGDVSDYISLNPGTVDPYITSPAGIGVATGSTGIGYNKLVFSMKSACTNKVAKVYFKRTTDGGFDEARSVSATLVGSDWNTVTFNMSSNASWNGTIDRIRLDPASSCSSGSTDQVSLRYAFFSR